MINNHDEDAGVCHCAKCRVDTAESEAQAQIAALRQLCIEAADHLRPLSNFYHGIPQAKAVHDLVARLESAGRVE